MSDNPFRITSSRDVYDNPWIRVVEHRIINPRGNPGLYGVVHFANRAVGVVPYHDGRIWLVGQYRFAIDAYSWEIPAGGAPPSEPLEDAARRELREETGLAVASLEWLADVHLSNSVTDETAVVYLGRGITRGEASPEETEEIQLADVPLEEAYRRVKTGAITDALTVIAVLELLAMKLEGRL